MKKTKIEIPEGFEIESFDKEKGEVTFTPKPINIISRIKTIDDAVKILGEEDPDVKDYWKIESTGITSHVIWHQKLIVITKALNEGWIPDWENGEYDKYFNWWNMSSSSSGRFSVFGSVNQYSVSRVGSRLCFKSRELAEYAAEQFKDIYEKAYTI